MSDLPCRSLNGKSTSLLDHLRQNISDHPHNAQLITFKLREHAQVLC
jgi:hypothetical protein